MATHEWEYEIKGFDGPGRIIVTRGETTAETAWIIQGPWPRSPKDWVTEVMADEILRLAEENAKIIEGSRIMLKAFSILAETVYEAFHDGADSVEDLRGTLEAAGLIEMLPDQTWGLTELGGRVCRREP